MFQPLIAAAAAARKKIASQGREGAEEYVGGYRDAPKRLKKGFDETAKAAEKAAKDSAKAAQKAAKDQEKAYEHVYQIRRRYMEQEERDEQRSLDRQAKNRQKMISAAGRTIGGLALQGLGRVGSAGVGLASDAVRESLETQAIATRVSINARGPGQDAIDPTVLRKEFERAAVATPGVSAQDIGHATQAYVDLTGDIGTARASMKTFATVASATGADVKDVATAAASLGQKFNLSSEDMKTVFAQLAAAGKGGAITLGDAAAQFQKLAAAGGAFGIGKGPEAVAKLNGLLQVARQGTRSPQQAGTAVENIFQGLTTKGKQLHAAGVNVYDKQGGKRDIDEVLAETIAKVGGTNAEAKDAGLAKIFGSRGLRGVAPLLLAYKDATHGKTGKEAQEAGYNAVLAALHKANGAASDWSEIEKDAAAAQQDASAQLKGAWEVLKQAAGEKLAPALANLATSLLKTDALDSVVTTFVALGEAAQLAVDGLKFIGLLKPKEVGPQEKLKKAQDDLDLYNKKRVTGPETAAQFAKRQQLEQAVDAARNEAYAPVVGSKDAKHLSKVDYLKQYAELGGGLGGAVKSSINPLSYLGNLGLTFDSQNDFAHGLTGENGAQSRLRHQYEEQERADADAGKLGASADKHSTAADKLAASADKLTAAADKLGGGAGAGAPRSRSGPGAPGAP